MPDNCTKYFFISIAFFVAGLVFFDQIVKYKIRSRGGFYICNTDLAFGLKFTPIFLVFALILLAFILAKIFGSHKSQVSNSKKNKNSNYSNSKQWFNILNFGNSDLFGIWYLVFSISFITAGAISNITDRALSGCVIDYIDLKFWPASIATRSFADWPIFNLADIFISLGAIMLVAELFRKKD